MHPDLEEWVAVEMKKALIEVADRAPTRWQTPTGILLDKWTCPIKLSRQYTSKWGRIEHKLSRMKYKNIRQWLYAYRWMRDTHPYVFINIYTSDRSKFDMVKEICLNPEILGVKLSDTMKGRIEKHYKLSVLSELG